MGPAESPFYQAAATADTAARPSHQERRDDGAWVIEKACDGHAEMTCRLDPEDERPLTYGRAIARRVRPTTLTSRRVSPAPGGSPRGGSGRGAAASGARQCAADDRGGRRRRTLDGICFQG